MRDFVTTAGRHYQPSCDLSRHFYKWKNKIAQKRRGLKAGVAMWNYSLKMLNEDRPESSAWLEHQPLKIMRK
jgi:hypothetical protein